MSMSGGREFQAERAPHANIEAVNPFEEYEERGKESNLRVNKGARPCRAL